MQGKQVEETEKIDMGIDGQRLKNNTRESKKKDAEGLLVLYLRIPFSVLGNMASKSDDLTLLLQALLFIHD